MNITTLFETECFGGHYICRACFFWDISTLPTAEEKSLTYWHCSQEEKRRKMFSFFLTICRLMPKADIFHKLTKIYPKIWSSKKIAINLIQASQLNTCICYSFSFFNKKSVCFFLLFFFLGPMEYNQGLCNWVPASCEKFNAYFWHRYASQISILPMAEE